jgi:hypothetical protein
MTQIDHIARRNLDEDVRWIVEDFLETFRGTEIDSVMINFGERTQHTRAFQSFVQTVSSVSKIVFAFDLRKQCSTLA